MRLAPGYRVWGRTGLYEPLVASALGRSGADLRVRAVDALGLAAGARVLDLGTGTGLSLLPLAAVVGPAGRVTGLDPFPEMLDRARARLPAGAAVDLVVGHGEALPFADGAFDAVLSTFALTAVEEPARVLAEVRRVVAPGGRVVIAEVHHVNWRTPDGVNRAVTRALRPFNTWRGERDVPALLAAAGFAVEALPVPSPALSLTRGVRLSDGDRHLVITTATATPGASPGRGYRQVPVPI